ncbi:unnamed protein product, partial [Ectocarpus sp. 12 AP-2014]
VIIRASGKARAGGHVASLNLESTSLSACSSRLPGKLFRLLKHALSPSAKKSLWVFGEWREESAIGRSLIGSTLGTNRLRTEPGNMAKSLYSCTVVVFHTAKMGVGGG